MSNHKWVNVGESIWECSQPGCTVRRSGEESAGVWQRKQGAHWRRVSRQPIQDCVVYDEPAGPEKPAGECRGCDAPEEGPHRMSCSVRGKRQARVNADLQEPK